jgi:hypothetical protein
MKIWLQNLSSQPSWLYSAWFHATDKSTSTARHHITLREQQVPVLQAAREYIMTV